MANGRSPRQFFRLTDGYAQGFSQYGPFSPNWLVGWLPTVREVGPSPENRTSSLRVRLGGLSASIPISSLARLAVFQAIESVSLLTLSRSAGLPQHRPGPDPMAWHDPVADDVKAALLVEGYILLGLRF
jgi:hypothetical protein